MITESPPLTRFWPLRSEAEPPAWYGVRLVRFVPDRAGFLDLARRGRLAFVYREVVADSDTPVSAYAKLGRGPYSFLLESVVGGDKWAAYSFAGVRPRAVVRARGSAVEILTAEPSGELRIAEKVRADAPLRFVDDYLSKLAPAIPPGLPRFFGGAVGWLGYDAVRSFERLPSTKPDTLGLPEVCFALTDTVVIFDNLRGTVKVVAAADVSEGDPGRAYDDACGRIEAVLEQLARPAPPLRVLDPRPPTATPRSTVAARTPTRPACDACRSTSWRATPSRSSTRSGSRRRAPASTRSTSTARCA